MSKKNFSIKLKFKRDILSKARMKILAKHEFNQSVDELSKKDLIIILNIFDRANHRAEKKKNKIKKKQQKVEGKATKTGSDKENEQLK